ncbi:Mitochondrial import inner membrane translocase subunit TIM13 [Erysiphe neolycopersici]|uniref:Mitochondrial import inner membrane translocase subunit n=1 Tax=Erysiphe neolycopersici TaxID=212602 RepID=A0A420HST2_9PEZI|nr:Mitochondrial import inner membrane translocase subunit TIM13 [Erysiphe neolycopersici]
MSNNQDQKAAVTDAKEINVQMRQVRDEATLANGKQLIEKVNEHCFEKCVPKPGTALSSGETSCLTQCMEKYMMAWSIVHRQYTNRIATELGKGGV